MSVLILVIVCNNFAYVLHIWHNLYADMEPEMHTLNF